MLYYKNISILTIAAISLLCLSSCKKYLETKSNQSLSTPQTLDDIQLILQTPSLNEAMQLTNVGSDEYYLTASDWSAYIDLYRNGYVWAPQLDDDQDWKRQYNTVFYANTALFNLDHISADEQQERWNDLKGKALFVRAHAFYQIAQLYAPQYDNASASNDLGIPLRLTADFTQPSSRASVKQTYDQIIQDLTNTLGLLSDALPQTVQTKSQPTKVATYALLARIYLQIGDYTKAKENADACLKLYNTLIDFNDPAYVNPASSAPIARFNPEVIYYTSTGAPINATSRAKIDSDLYRSFAPADLRKVVFFNLNPDGLTFRFKGSYNGGSVDLFNGLATDEVYLIRAECNVRLNNIQNGLNDLDAVLSKRWTTGTFTYHTGLSQMDALNLILSERKKELIYRGIRWSDLKRLNKDPQFALTLQRKLDTQIYTLAPNDPRYALLIPQGVINLTGLAQNPR